MASHQANETDPDLTAGISPSAFGVNFMLRGHVGSDPVLLVRIGSEVVAVGALCSHYHAPLNEGLVIGDQIHCPWHHACFDLRSGEALKAPAFDPLTRWKVEHRDDLLFVTEKLPAAELPAPELAPNRPAAPKHIVIIGGGAAGFAAAEMLRRRRYIGELTLISADAEAPYDRPNLSKDYLAGKAEEAWMPLKSAKFYAKRNITLCLQTKVRQIDTSHGNIITEDERIIPFDRLLLATGAKPVRLNITGADRSHVFTLRSMADSRAIIEQATKSESAVVIGAGFIGLEAAAALRSRGLEVHVVAPGRLPLEKVLGPELGEFVKSLHEQHGVHFHMGNSVTRIDQQAVVLDDRRVLGADLVIIGIGVRPQIQLAEEGGLAIGNGVLVDEFMETSIEGIYAAGDIADWHDLHTKQSRRVEHWVVAERQGQIAAENMLGMKKAFKSPPFFWSEHYDVSIRYVGYAHGWDRIEVEGDINQRDCLVKYIKDERIVAIAAIGRDLDALDYEAAMPRA